MTEEIYKPSPVFPNNYSVSNYGNVINNKTGYKRKLCLNKDGYYYVHLWNGGESKYCLVHRLVGFLFLDGHDSEHKNVINHINGIKTDNHFSNLEWCDVKHNTRHSYSMGLQKPIKGSKHGRSKYKEHQVIKVCELLSNTKKTMKEISSVTGVSLRTIQSIGSRVNWTVISDDYNLRDGRSRKNV